MSWHSYQQEEGSALGTAKRDTNFWDHFSWKPGIFFQPFSWQQNKMFLRRGQNNFQLCLWRQTHVSQNMISLNPNQVVLCLNPTRPLAQCCHNIKMKPEHKETQSFNITVVCRNAHWLHLFWPLGCECRTFTCNEVLVLVWSVLLVLFLNKWSVYLFHFHCTQHVYNPICLWPSSLVCSNWKKMLCFEIKLIESKVKRLDC